MRIVPINRLVHHWVNRAFECYDFEPMRPGRIQKLRTHAFDLGRELLRDGVPPEEAAEQVFFSVETSYIVFHLSAKRLHKTPCVMSCRRAGARRLSEYRV